MLTKGYLELLLVTVDGIRGRAQDQVGDKTDKRHDRNDAPCPPSLRAAGTSVLDDVHDGQQV